MKTLKQIIAETVNPPKSPDERRFIAKHRVDVIDHPVTTDAQETGGKTAKDKSRKADRQKPEDELVYEMSDAQMKKREEIVKSMKKKQADFKDRYGDKWKEVMYATATKQAMKEQLMFEARLQGVMELRDGSKVKVSEADEKALNSLFAELNGSNRRKMEARMMENTKGYKEILQFAKEAM